MSSSDPRYDTAEMTAIWSPERRFALMARVAALAGRACGRFRTEAGRLMRTSHRLAAPREAARFLRAVRREEARTRHETAAFVVVLSRLARAPRLTHFGLTSYDLVDTALGVQMRDAADVLLAGADHLGVALSRLARRHRRTVMAGRTHGMVAEPITFGRTASLWAEAVARARRGLAAARSEVAVGKLSGAVGTYAHLPPSVEASVCRALGLRAVPSTQVVPRDRHAAFLQACARMAAVLEAMATDLRLLQQSGVEEVEEPFESGQMGSSSMPHKRNPWRSERVCGLARVVRALASAQMESVALWHERDMSHSSVERITLPGATGLLHFMLREMEDIIARLRVDPDRMRLNLAAGGGMDASERVMLALVEAGWPRARAYRLVQRLAGRARAGRESFRALVESTPEIRSRFAPAQVESWFRV